MKVSVIVPVRDDPRIDDLLNALALQQAAPEFEILVALDGSSRQPRVPAGLTARLLRLPPRNPYVARNAAARAATGDVLLFTDSDCLPPPDWIATAARFFASAAMEALQGSSVAGSDRRLSRFIQLEYERYVAAHAAFGYRRFCNTRNFAIRAELARRVPLPETFARGGDGAWGRELEANGVAIRYEPEWWVVHRHPSHRGEEGRRAYEQGRFGALWERAAEVPMFQDTPASSGPGAFLVRRLPKSALARRIASAALLPVAAILGVASTVLPERAAYRSFSLFRRACHLAGRFRGESEG